VCGIVKSVWPWLGMLWVGKMSCRLEAWARWDGAGGRWAVDNPHAMGARCDEFRDGMGESADGRHVEDGIRVLAVVEAALGEDD
jgi:hypothetical protein